MPDLKLGQKLGPLTRKQWIVIGGGVVLGGGVIYYMRKRQAQAADASTSPLDSSNYPSTPAAAYDPNYDPTTGLPYGSGGPGYGFMGGGGDGFYGGGYGQFPPSPNIIIKNIIPKTPTQRVKHRKPTKRRPPVHVNRKRTRKGHPASMSPLTIHDPLLHTN